MTEQPTAPWAADQFISDDLARLACLAAIELDNLSLERCKDLPSLGRLADLLDESLTNVTNPSSPSSQLNTTTAIIVCHALNDSGWSDSLSLIDDLVELTGELTVLMRGVCRAPLEPAQHDRDSIIKLGEFCLAVSRWSQALEDRYSWFNFTH
ncbi:MAG: hypothetical protein O2857_08545 [Planctomycetota bacterium]|nr:hypothetical protein [Planctomycetota bacterium]